MSVRRAERRRRHHLEGSLGCQAGDEAIVDLHPPFVEFQGDGQGLGNNFRGLAGARKSGLAMQRSKVTPSSCQRPGERPGLSQAFLCQRKIGMTLETILGITD